MVEKPGKNYQVTTIDETTECRFIALECKAKIINWSINFKVRKSILKTHEKLHIQDKK